MNKLILSLFLLLPTAVGFSQEATNKMIVMVGRDSQQNSVSRIISAEDYRKGLISAIQSTNESILPILEIKTEPTTDHPYGGWHINSVGVGIGLSGGIGLGPLVNAAVNSQIRLVFTNSTNPIYPN